MYNDHVIAVVIPCYKVKKHIFNVISKIPNFVDLIICIDDKCPELSGDFISQNIADSRLVLVLNDKNTGVGGAVLRGYQKALDLKSDIVVKIDGDDQMDSSIMCKFITPIVQGRADYTKGNRFWSISNARDMPRVRFLGNVALSFLTKASSGYWHIFDPTNGYTAIHRTAISLIPMNKIAQRYFFESDMLYHLGICGATVLDIPMRAKYGDEISNLRIKSILLDFSVRHTVNFFKRIWYMYFLRDFNFGSICIMFSFVMITGGVMFGIYHWLASFLTGVPATAGQVGITALAIGLGAYFLMNFMREDLSRVDKSPLSQTFADPVKQITK